MDPKASRLQRVAGVAAGGETDPERALARAQAAYLSAALEAAEAFLRWSRCAGGSGAFARDLEARYTSLVGVLREKAIALERVRSSGL